MGWGLFLKAPFQSWAAAAGWEEAGAPHCREGLPGLPRGPGRIREVPAGCSPNTFAKGLSLDVPSQSTVGCRLPAQVTTLWMGSVGLFAAMSSLEGHMEGGWGRGSASSAGVPGVWQVMEELNLGSPWLMMQGLEVRMEG